MTDLFHVDQSTADRWRADGRFVLFGEGELAPPTGVLALDPRFTEVPHPPAAMIEAAKACETCGGTNCTDPRMDLPFGVQCRNSEHACRACSNGQRRHPVTVPCYCAPIREAGRTWPYGDCLVPEPCSNGRISTGLLAVVEWGPLEVIGQTDEPRPIQGAFDRSFITLRHHNGKPFLVRFTQGQRGEGEVLTLPPDVDPASLVGQWAIGGRIEVAG